MWRTRDKAFTLAEGGLFSSREKWSPPRKWLRGLFAWPFLTLCTAEAVWHQQTKPRLLAVTVGQASASSAAVFCLLKHVCISPRLDVSWRGQPLRLQPDAVCLFVCFSLCLFLHALWALTLVFLLVQPDSTVSSRLSCPPADFTARHLKSEGKKQPPLTPSVFYLLGTKRILGIMASLRKQFKVSLQDVTLSACNPAWCSPHICYFQVLKCAHLGLVV